MVGTFYTAKCGGIRYTVPSRCTQPSRGLGKHCADHPGWNLHDSIALLVFAPAVGTLYLWFTYDGATVLLDSVQEFVGNRDS